jgi:hypothetical protein
MPTPDATRPIDAAQVVQARRMRFRSLTAMPLASVASDLNRTGYTAEAFRHRYGERNDREASPRQQPSCRLHQLVAHVVGPADRGVSMRVPAPGFRRPRTVLRPPCRLQAASRQRLGVSFRTCCPLAAWRSELERAPTRRKRRARPVTRARWGGGEGIEPLTSSVRVRNGHSGLGWRGSSLMSSVPEGGCGPSGVK